MEIAKVLLSLGLVAHGYFASADADLKPSPKFTYANNVYQCTNFIKAPLSQLANREAQLGEVFYDGVKGTSSGQSFILSLKVSSYDGRTAELSQGNGSVPMTLIGNSQSLITPLRFYRTDRLPTNRELTTSAMGPLKTHLIERDKWLNIIAVVGERFGLLFPETGDAISVCKLSNSSYDYNNIKDELGRIQDALVRSGFMREILSARESTFSTLSEVIGQVGLKDSQGNFILKGSLVRSVEIAGALLTIQQIIKIIVRDANPETIAMMAMMPSPQLDALRLDLKSIGLTADQVREFFSSSGSEQNEACKLTQYQALCKMASEWEFKLRGGGA